MYLTMKKVVVTGGAGFIGRHVTKKLIAEGYETHIIDSLVGSEESQVNPQAIFHKLDINETEEVARICTGAEGIFHLAALPSVPFSIEDPITSAKTNLLGTISILQAAKEAGVKRVIFSSSSAVYGEQEILPVAESAETGPRSPYGLQKLQSEEQCRLFSELYRVETVCLRYFNVYGKGQNPDGPYASVIPKFIRLRQEGKPLTVTGDGSQTRDFVHVNDVAEANFLAFTSPEIFKGEIINVGSGKEWTVKDIAEMIGGEIEYIEARKEIKRSVADAIKAEKMLRWKVRVGFTEGIKEILEK
ncbi:MAG: NAD-dependent epimerase/dehydratase family protein [Candidatus Harrisonbacteria bacterium]|nr:NAD-dependent epimerase/dehydratase family protein [Candidatus Harrisonbacteria bacterium]